VLAQETRARIAPQLARAAVAIGAGFRENLRGRLAGIEILAEG